MLAVIVYAILGVNDRGIDARRLARESGGHYAVRLCSGGRTGIYAAAGRPGGGVPRRS